MSGRLTHVLASLSSLVAARGVATMAEVEEAITRQVLHGGDLVTSLLEILDRTKEPQLTGVLAEHLLLAPTFSPLPPASPELLRLLPADLARRHTIYPIAYTQRSLTVAVWELLPEEALGDLSFVLGRSIVQAAAPAVRIREALLRDYAIPLDRRLLRLLARLDGQRDPSPSSLPPPRRRPTEDGPLPSLPGAPSVPSVATVFGTFRRPTLTGFALPRAAPLPEVSPQPTATDLATAPDAPHPASVSAERTASDLPPRADVVRDRLAARPTPAEVPVAKRSERPPPPASSVPPPAPSTPAPHAEERSRLSRFQAAAQASFGAPDLLDADAALVPARPQEVMSWARTAIVHGKAPRKRRRGPMSVSEAEAALVEAAEAPDALDAFFDFAQQYFVYSALFFIQGDVAGGRDAHGPGADRHKVNGIGIPLDLPSCFAHVRRTGAPFAGLANREGIEGEVISDLQRPAEVGFLLVPVSVRGRCVAFLYADDGGDDMRLGMAGETLGLAGLLGRALERIAVEKKNRRARTEAPPIPDLPPPRAKGELAPAERRSATPSNITDTTTAKLLPIPESRSRLPSAAAVPEEGPSPQVSSSETGASSWTRPHATPPEERARVRVEAPRGPALTDEQTELLRSLLAPDARVGEVLPLVVRQGAAMASALVATLPGPTDVPRASVIAGDARPSHTGPVFRALVAMRRVALPYVIGASDSHDAALRFFSTFLLGELPFEGAAHAVAARLFDANIDVQRIAVVAARLLGPSRPVAAPVLDRLKQVLREEGESPSRRRRAATVLGQLHARSAVPDLIAALRGDLAEHARGALVTITCQDYADDAATWQLWWDRSQTKHRVEWLIDALVHFDPDLRVRAAEELRTLAPRSGLSRVATAPRDELEELHRRYGAWWRESGHAEAAALDE